jgi:hypothetical protein
MSSIEYHADAVGRTTEHRGRFGNPVAHTERLARIRQERALPESFDHTLAGIGKAADTVGFSRSIIGHVSPL